MTAIWTIVVVLLLALIACFFILRWHVQQVNKQREVVIEALWQRRNRLPLLLELLPNQEMIELRARVMSGAYNFSEQIEMERRCTQMLANLFRNLPQSPAGKQAFLVALQEEFVKVHEEIDRAVNDYRYALAKVSQLLKQPWFKFFQFSVNFREIPTIQEV